MLLSHAGSWAALTGPNARRRRSSSASRSSPGPSGRSWMLLSGSSPLRPSAGSERGSSGPRPSPRSLRSSRSLCPELFHDLVGNVVVRVDVLHVVGVLESLDQPDHFPRVLLVQVDLDRGQERPLC